MLTSVSTIPLAARRLAGGALICLLAGCAGDGLLLPRDGAPAELRMVSGDRQSAPAGDPVGDPLIVEALDAVGRPVPGAVIVFKFVDAPSGAELAPANTETDAAGRASAQVTLGTPPGDQHVEASLDGPGSDLSVQFRLIALAPAGGGDDEGGGGGGGDEGGGGGDDGEGGDEGGGGNGGGGDDGGDGGGGGGGGGGPPDDGGGGGDDDGDDDGDDGDDGGVDGDDGDHGDDDDDRDNRSDDDGKGKDD